MARGAFRLDSLLLPRIEQYAHNNPISDIDATIEYLRSSYREYQRKQLIPFRKSVLKAVSIVKRRIQEEQEAEQADSSRSRRRSKVSVDRLENTENEHLKRRGFRQAGESSDSDDEDDSEFDEENVATKSAVSVKGELDFSDDGIKPSRNPLSSSLLTTYSSRPALVIQSPTFNGISVFGNLQVKPAAMDEGNASASTASPLVTTLVKGNELLPKEKVPSVATESPPRTDAKQKSKKRGRDNEFLAKTLKKDRRSGPVNGQIIPQNVSFKDFGGLGKNLDDIAEYVFSILMPQPFERIGLEVAGGLLLHGPPGCGKSMLAEAIANEASVPYFRMSAPEIVTGTSGESEANLRQMFTEVSRLAPSILFVDEIDAISGKRESAHREMERRIVTQLMTCMDDLGRADDGKGRPVLVIGATNRPDALDEALRRRFQREICLGIPDEKARLQILKVLTKRLRLDGDFNFNDIARRTPGFAGADLKALTKEAGMSAVRQIIKSRKSAEAEQSLLESLGETAWWKLPWSPEELEALSITMQDFEVALTKVQPSTKREGFTEIPTVTWDDVGALDSVRAELELFICYRIKHPEDYEALNFTDSGFLLHGPPGCGKTLLAKAVANAAGANFIYIKAAELLNKYVGESERGIRHLFSRARACSPCLIFFDEVDAIAPCRGNEANVSIDRVVNQLLVEMDGLEQRKGIYLIAATNRLNMIDEALLRPGRLGKLVYVPLPDEPGRVSILKALLRRLPVCADVDIAGIAKSCEKFSGADLQGLIQEASAAALRERLPLWRDGNPKGSLSLEQKHFDDALTRVKPSVKDPIDRAKKKQLQLVMNSI